MLTNSPCATSAPFSPLAAVPPMNEQASGPFLQSSKFEPLLHKEEQEPLIPPFLGISHDIHTPQTSHKFVPKTTGIFPHHKTTAQQISQDDSSESQSASSSQQPAEAISHTAAVGPQSQQDAALTQSAPTHQQQRQQAQAEDESAAETQMPPSVSSEGSSATASSQEPSASTQSSETKPLEAAPQSQREQQGDLAPVEPSTLEQTPPDSSPSEAPSVSTEEPLAASRSELAASESQGDVPPIQEQHQQKQARPEEAEQAHISGGLSSVAKSVQEPEPTVPLAGDVSLTPVKTDHEETEESGSLAEKAKQVVVDAVKGIAAKVVEVKESLKDAAARVTEPSTETTQAASSLSQSAKSESQQDVSPGTQATQEQPIQPETTSQMQPAQLSSSDQPSLSSSYPAPALFPYPTTLEPEESAQSVPSAPEVTQQERVPLETEPVVPTPPQVLPSAAASILGVASELKQGVTSAQREPQEELAQQELSTATQPPKEVSSDAQSMERPVSPLSHAQLDVVGLQKGVPMREGVQSAPPDLPTEPTLPTSAAELLSIQPTSSLPDAQLVRKLEQSSTAVPQSSAFELQQDTPQSQETSSAQQRASEMPQMIERAQPEVVTETQQNPTVPPTSILQPQPSEDESVTALGQSIPTVMLLTESPTSPPPSPNETVVPRSRGYSHTQPLSTEKQASSSVSQPAGSQQTAPLMSSMLSSLEARRAQPQPAEPTAVSSGEERQPSAAMTSTPPTVPPSSIAAPKRAVHRRTLGQIESSNTFGGEDISWPDDESEEESEVDISTTVESNLKQQNVTEGPEEVGVGERVGRAIDEAVTAAAHQISEKAATATEAVKEAAHMTGEKLHETAEALKGMASVVVEDVRGLLYGEPQTEAPRDIGLGKPTDAAADTAEASIARQ